MNKEEWKQVEDALSSFFRMVELDADGYKVSLRLERVSQFKNAIVVYVNGSFKGEWLIEDCEERRRFIQPRTRSLLRGKEKAEILKGLNKKERKEAEERMKYTTYITCWSKFAS